MSFLLTSTAFEDGQPIPLDYTREGRDVSPPLKWTDPPAGTRSLALICEDHDAPRGKAKGTRGVVAVGDNDVRVEIDLPFLLRMLKGTVESRVEDKLRELL